MEIIELSFALPLEIFEHLIFDVKTLLVIELFARQKFKKGNHLEIIERKKLAFQSVSLDLFYRLRYFPNAKSQIEMFLAPYSLQKKIRILLEARSPLGYDLFLQLPAESRISNHLYKKYYKIILFSMILRDHWEQVIASCSYMSNLVESFEVIRRLSPERQQTVIDNLDPESNFLLILLIEKVDTGIDAEDARRIRELGTAPGQRTREQILTSFRRNVDVRVDFVNALIYYFQKDPRLDEPDQHFGSKRDFLDNYVRAFGGRSLVWPEQKFEYPVFVVRGSDADHGKVLLDYLRSYYRSTGFGQLPTGKWLDNFKVDMGVEYGFILSALAPSILKKYSRNLIFSPKKEYETYPYDQMIDIFDYQEKIPEILHQYHRFFKVYPSKRFMLEEFGVLL